MLNNLTNVEHSIFIKVYGRLFKVMAIADNDDEANAFMEANPGASCIAVQGGMVYIADKNDKGTKA